jgi:hypothetical protein
MAYGTIAAMSRITPNPPDAASRSRRRTTEETSAKKRDTLQLRSQSNNRIRSNALRGTGQSDGTHLLATRSSDESISGSNAEYTNHHRGDEANLQPHDELYV